ncbi:hypothetical protein K7432_005235 [Basidiobolus ranarum]|uniref:Uncharacterized protein n=1 Tax=Basidiobolus ranarum TaxID=34480 RepID=A0ABR2WWU8_9FUNG
MEQSRYSQQQFYAPSGSSLPPQEYYISPDNPEATAPIKKNSQLFKKVGYTVLLIQLVSSGVILGLKVRDLLLLEQPVSTSAFLMTQSIWLPLCVAGLRMILALVGILGLYKSSYRLMAVVLVFMALVILGTLSLLILSAVANRFSSLWMPATTLLLDMYFCVMFYRYFRLFRKEKYVLLE